MASDGGPLRPQDELQRVSVAVDELDRTRLRVGLNPLATAGMLVFDSVQCDGFLGVPQPVRRAIRSRLRDRDLAVLAPLVRSTAPPSLIGRRVAPPAGLPRVLCGTTAPGRTSFGDMLDRVAASDPGEFLAATAGCVPADSDRSWWALRSDPARWLRGYAVALRRAWREVEPLWQRSGGLLDRELERVGAAMARGASADVVAAMHPHGSVADGKWKLPAGAGSADRCRVASSFTVCPMVVGPRATVAFQDEEGSLRGLFYALPGAGRSLGADGAPPASLEALVGAQRATILRRLDAPVTCGQIAEALYTVPGGATHHVRALEASGLVSRVRQGMHVYVERTARGSALLALYDAP